MKIDIRDFKIFVEEQELCEEELMYCAVAQEHEFILDFGIVGIYEMKTKI